MQNYLFYSKALIHASIINQSERIEPSNYLCFSKQQVNLSPSSFKELHNINWIISRHSSEMLGIT
jgi:hypothetical protein